MFFADLGDGLLRVFLGLFFMTGLNRRCGVTLFFRVTEQNIASFSGSLASAEASWDAWPSGNPADIREKECSPAVR